MARPVNTLKLIKNTKGKINRGYILSIDNIVELKSNSRDIYDLIYNTFIFGYAQGVKAQKKGCAYNG